MPSLFRGRHWGRPTLLLTALVAALAFVLPASASALVYEVDGIGDQVDEAAAGCKTSVNNCTLRAAIEVSNSTAEDDEITFKPSLFNGESLGAIMWTGPTEPSITDTVKINGDGSGQCDTEAETEAGAKIKGPCVGINANGGNGIKIAGADGVTIEGLAILNAANGIAALAIGSPSEELTVRNTWLGVGLSGGEGFIGTGILLGPEADGAIIGAGISATERNVFVNANFNGLDIQGASDATVRGNWFGVRPDGEILEQARNEDDIEITAAFTAPAIENRIGSHVGGAAETPACDGGCNVIANAAEAGIDMRGEQAPGEGPAKETAIYGNFVGLAPDGSAAPNGFYGVDAGSSIDTLVGGSDGEDANHVSGSYYGIYAENAPGVIVEGNAIGMNSAETVVALDPAVGVGVSTDGSIAEADRAVVSENRIASGTAGVGIQIQAGPAYVIDNTVGLGAGGARLGAGAVGIYAYENPGGTRIEGDTVIGASEYGVLLEGPNEIEASTILDSGEAGVLIREDLAQNPLVGAVVGGEEPLLESEISGSGGPAIALVGPKVDQTYMFRNHGSGNEGPFIDLEYNGQGNEPGNGHPNGGIQAPTIDSATATSASGTAKPEALIRVFRKATPEPGEIESYLASAEADSSGSWSTSFAAVPGSTNLAASQTTAGDGTSEFKLTITPPDPPPPVVCAAAGGGCNPPPGGMKPDTKIAKKPKLKGAPTAKFKFTSTMAGSSFECKLDKKPFKKCRSPKTYKKLKPGKHVFKVRAVSPAGVKDPTPAKKQFKVKE